MRQANPFTPSAGVEPPALIGREDVLYDFEESLLAGVGAPRRLMRITGPRFNQEKKTISRSSIFAKRSMLRQPLSLKREKACW